MTLQPLLNWQTDPLLLDFEPQEVAEWRTLNDLLQEVDPKVKAFYSQHPLQNFYGILIRKIDFIKNTNKSSGGQARILTRMPFLPLEHYPSVKESLEETLWATAEAARNYFYRSALNDPAIGSWKKRLERYLDRESLPLPFARLNPTAWCTLKKQTTDEQKIIIQSAKSERSTIPLVLSEKLVYLLGIIDGDGHLTKHQLHIVDYSKDQIKQLLAFCFELFNINGELRKGVSNNYYYMILNSKWVIRLINFLTNHHIGRKYESLQEPIFLRKGVYKPLRIAYWGGLFDADGSFHKTVTFSSISEKLVVDLEQYLQNFNVAYSLRKAGKTFTIYIYAGSRTKLQAIILSLHPQKKMQLLELTNKELKPRGKKRRLIKLRFQGLNKKRIINGKYLDFSFLSEKIIVCNAEVLIKRLREQEGLSRKTLAQLLNVSYETIATYEAGRISPTLKVIARITQIFYSKKQGLMDFLEQHSLSFFRIKNHTIKLPLTLSKELLEIVPNLKPLYGNYVSISFRTPEFIDRVVSFFHLKNKWEKSSRICNYVLHDFLETFFIYKIDKT